jgi:hypothetical protein
MVAAEEAESAQAEAAQEQEHAQAEATIEEFVEADEVEAVTGDSDAAAADGAEADRS